MGVTSFLLISGRDRFDHAQGVQAGALRGKRSHAGRRCVEDVEADLVFRYVDRAVEADARVLSRKLLGGRACLPLARGAFCRLAASEVGLDEVARHSLEATAMGLRRKRQN